MRRLDDLQFNNLRFLQDDESYCFGCDAVELADFAAVKRGESVCDIGAASGILSVLLAAKKGAKVTAVEIRQNAALLCAENAAVNDLGGFIDVVNKPIREFCVNLNKGKFDAVVCNPPYQKAGSGFVPPSADEAAARYEIFLTLEQLAESASHLLKFGGKFFVVYPVERLAEAVAAFKSNLLEPKILQILRPAYGKSPHIFLMQCTKNGKTGLKVLPERAVRTEV